MPSVRQNIAAVSSESVSHAAALLAKDSVVALPTETVYGLAGNAFSPTALACIFQVKARPFFDPLIIHALSAEEAFRLAKSVPELAQRAAERFWPGPLTLVLLKTDAVPDLATSGGPTVAVRVPSHPAFRAVLAATGFPLAAPSANRFGRISPTSAEAVYAELGESVPLIMDAGPCAIGLESTVLDLTDEQPRLLRAGGVPLEELEALLGTILIPPPANLRDDETTAHPSSPGQLKSHYAPRKPLRIVADARQVPRDAQSGWLAFGHDFAFTGFPGALINISPAGDLREAAAQFFGTLRRLDEAPEVQVIYAQPFPDEGLGRALNDRLRRAEGR